MSPSSIRVALLVLSFAPGIDSTDAVAAPSSLSYEEVQDLGVVGVDSLSPLTVGRDGNVYGSKGLTIYRVDAAGGFSPYHTFSETEGMAGRLVIGNDGLMYGYTGQRAEVEWDNHQGVFFRLDYNSNYTQLLSLPHTLASDLVVGSDGFFYAGAAYHYGTTEGLFFWNDTGLVKISPQGVFTIIGGDYDLLSPTPKVVGSDGAMYGIVRDTGGIFRVDTLGNFTTINTNALGVQYLALGSDGLIYGSAPYNEWTGEGTLVRFDNAGIRTLLHAFVSATSGAHPFGDLTVGKDGAIYGVTLEGGGSAGVGAGTVYRIDTAGIFTSLHSFNYTDGSYPEGELLLAKDGALYGVTNNGSPNPAVFRVDSSGTLTYPMLPADLIASFPLVQGNDCALYGIAYSYQSQDLHSKLYRVFEPGHLCQQLAFEPLPDSILGDAPFTATATASSGLAVSFSASGSCSVSGDQVTLTDVGPCTLTASQVGDERFGPAEEVSESFDVLFDFSGFLRPIESPPAFNRAIAGQAVPIRFALGGGAGRDVLAEGSPEVRPISCDTLAPLAEFEPAIGLGSKELFHRRGSERYLFPCKTRRDWAGSCRELALELDDGTVHQAYFRFPGRRHRDQARR